MTPTSPRNRRLFITLGLLVALGALAFVLLRAPRPDPPIAWAVCGAPVHDLDLEITGELLLHRDLAPEGLPDAFLRDAVALQIRHAFAATHNDPAWTTILTPDGPPHDLELLTRTDTPYDQSLTFDWPDDPLIKPESDYIRRALARRTVAADDPAIRVAWRARVRVAACDPDGKLAEQFTLPVPHDPHTLHWTVPAARRVEHTYFNKRVIGFPCADPDIADYAHPEYLWYYWQPRRAGCEDLSTPAALGSVSVRILRQRPPGDDLTAWRDTLAADLGDRPLRVALVFGFLNHQVARPDPARVRDALRTGGDPDGDPEWGTDQFLIFTRRTTDLLTDRSLTVLERPDPAVALHGALRRSSRRVEITAHLTETDYLAPPDLAPRHAPILLDALKNADVIIYAGHSGLGLNFSRAQIEKDTAQDAVADALAASPARLVAFIGCYTYAYFGDDLAAGLPRADDTLFMYTGNSVAETADSALHILHTLDCLLAGAAGPGACQLPPPGLPGAHDFLIYSPMSAAR